MQQTRLALTTAAATLTLGFVATPVSGARDAAITGARRHDRPDSLYRALAGDPAFRVVGAVRSGDRHLGSGVLIAPQWVLTDAHVVTIRADGRTIKHPADTIIVRFDSTDVAVAESIIHPGYWADSVPSTADVLARKGIDLALLRLARPVAGIPPAELLTREPEPGTPGIFVGFGTSGTAQSVITSPERPGVRRAGTNIIDQVGGAIGAREIPPFLLVADFDAPHTTALNRTGDASPTNLEFMPVGGDSGGGVFVRINDRVLLAGLIATGTIAIAEEPSSGIYGSVAYATSVAGVSEWIARHIGAR